MNWIIPPDKDVQVSKSTDFEACASYSAVHIAEMVLKKKTGYFFEFSERYTAKASDTTPQGNSLKNVVDALNASGLCLVDYWPELTYSTKYEDIDWAEYYAAIPDSVFKKAYRVKAQFRPLKPSEVAQALETAPVWTVVKVSSGQLHCVAQINDTQFFDSYEVKVKNFSDGYPIQSQYQLTLIFENMPNSYLIQVNKKDGTKEIAVALPAIDGGALIDKCLNTGLPIQTVNNDGKTVDWPNLPIRYQVSEQ